jgi:WD40 repeat protein
MYLAASPYRQFNTPGGPLIRTLEGHTGSVTAVVVTNDGNRVISASNNRTLKVWDLETWEHMGALVLLMGIGITLRIR